MDRPLSDVLVRSLFSERGQTLSDVSARKLFLKGGRHRVMCQEAVPGGRYRAMYQQGGYFPKGVNTRQCAIKDVGP